MPQTERETEVFKEGFRVGHTYGVIHEQITTLKFKHYQEGFDYYILPKKVTKKFLKEFNLKKKDKHLVIKLCCELNYAEALFFKEEPGPEEIANCKGEDIDPLKVIMFFYKRLY